MGELIKSALEPVLSQTVADHPENPTAAILRLKVLDPACGSGHFLLAAARRMAAEIARLESDDGTMDETIRQHALREVVQHCNLRGGQEPTGRGIVQKPPCGSRRWSRANRCLSWIRTSNWATA